MRYSAAKMDRHIESYSKDIYDNIFIAFFISSVLSYVSVLYILPIVLEVSFILSAIMLTVVLGTNVLITITLVSKLFMHLISRVKKQGKSVASGMMDADNTFLLTHSRYS